MTTYLEKFNSTIRKKQTEQILKLLSKQRSTGQIRTVEEFTTKLDNLVRELTQTTLTPTLKVFKAEADELASSEAHNFMLDRVEDDLTAAFGEAYNIDQVQKAHQAIMKDVLLKNLKKAIDELDGKISLYEFINNEGQGYSASIFSTFRESKDDRLQKNDREVTKSNNRQTAQANQVNLFVDPRSNQSFSNDESAFVDLVGERLVLPSNPDNLVTIRSVEQIFDSDTVTSAETISPAYNKIANMLDGQSGTYWVQGIVSKDNTLTAVTTKLQFDLEATRTLNFLQIQSANNFPFTLKKIYYLDTANVIRLLQEPNLSIENTVSHYFPTISTSRLILEFESTHKVPAHFTTLVTVKGVQKPEPAYFQPSDSITVTEQAANEPILGHSTDPQITGIALQQVNLTPDAAKAAGYRPENKKE